MQTYESLQQCAHPLVFRAGVPEVPLSVWVTAFMLGTQKRVFVVTARHLVVDNHPDDLCVASPSGRLVPLMDSYVIDPQVAKDDWADIAIFEIPLGARIQQAPDAGLLHLALAGGNWEDLANVSRFFVVGFPREHPGVDYEAREFQGGMVELKARYLGPASVDGLTHRLQIVSAFSLESSAGFSGSSI